MLQVSSWDILPAPASHNPVPPVFWEINTWGTGPLTWFLQQRKVRHLPHAALGTKLATGAAICRAARQAVGLDRGQALTIDLWERGVVVAVMVEDKEEEKEQQQQQKEEDMMVFVVLVLEEKGTAAGAGLCYAVLSANTKNSSSSPHCHSNTPTPPGPQPLPPPAQSPADCTAYPHRTKALSCWVLST